MIRRNPKEIDLGHYIKKIMDQKLQMFTVQHAGGRLNTQWVLPMVLLNASAKGSGVVPQSNAAQDRLASCCVNLKIYSVHKIRGIDITLQIVKIFE